MSKLVATQRLEAVRPDSLAQKAGLQRGDYVLAVRSSSLNLHLILHCVGSEFDISTKTSFLPVQTLNFEQFGDGSVDRRKCCRLRLTDDR